MFSMLLRQPPELSFKITSLKLFPNFCNYNNVKIKMLQENYFKIDTVATKLKIIKFKVS